MSGHKKTDVLVVGGGPTGLIAALALAEAGVVVEVIEEQPDTAGHSYALALHPASIEMLERLDVRDPAVAVGRRIPGLAIYEGTERRAELPVGDADRPLLALPQSGLETLLSERLAQKGVRVRFSHRLARLEPDRDGLRAVVHRLERETTGYSVARSGWVVDREIRYDAAYVVGADGHASLVRRILDIPFEEVSPSQVYAVIECAARNSVVQEMRLMLGEDAIDAFWPLPSGRVRFSFAIQAPEVGAGERFKSRLASRVGERYFHVLDDSTMHALVTARAPWFDLDPDSFGWSIEVRFERRLAASFGRDRAWLAGDAAHLTGPAGMQSMNAGMREAFDLASRLAAVLRHGRTNTVLEDYGRDRRREWRFLLGQAGGLAARPATPPFAAKHAARLLACLPGTDEGLDRIASAMGLDPVRV